METDGIENLSVRKIASSAGYSPAILYHYFKNKSEILENLLGEGYRNILNAVGSVEIDDRDPKKELRQIFHRFAQAAFEHSGEYKAFTLSEDPLILEKTSLLSARSAAASQTLRMLTGNIRRGIRNGSYRNTDPELTAQVLWASVFGMVIRLILETDVTMEERDRLLSKQLDILIGGISSYLY